MRSASWMLLVFWLTPAVTSPGTVGAGEIDGEGTLQVAQAERGSPSRRPSAQTRRPSGFAARWIGQDGQDWTGLGPSVGPDGLQDVHIALSKLEPGVAVKAVRIEGAGKIRWEFGKNPRLLSNAELIRDAKGPAGGELYFQPDHDLKGERLKVMLAYDNDKFETATVVAGACDAGLRVPVAPLPQLNESALAATWLGQDGTSPGSAGDVHLAVTGWPKASAIVAGVLTDAVRYTWIYRTDGQATIPDDPEALPLLIKPPADGTSVDVFFSPRRDESKETMTLRLIAADGQNFVVRFPGRSSDLSLLAARPGPSRVEAKPGDDLQAFVEKYGTVVLTPGTFRLARPLVLNRPVTITAEGGATLLFDQGATEPAWSSAIKIHCGNTTLNGFAVRFAGPVRWNNEISWGPAVIGMTDNLEPHYNDPKLNLTFTHLDLEIPPVKTTSGWVDAVRLMRLIGAKNGVIAGNLLCGGPIEFFDGPWRIVDNDSRGTVAGSFSHEVFGAHASHDLLVRGNRARELRKGGKTWRFLVLVGTGYGDVIERNLIDGIGSIEGDTIPWSNEPEIILTESYKIKYEGTMMDLSSDGRLIRTGRPFTAGRTGDVVALLAGAGGRRVAADRPGDRFFQLSGRPADSGRHEGCVDIGRVCRRSLPGQSDRHPWRTEVVRPRLGGQPLRDAGRQEPCAGGESVFKLTACPTEAPMMWGWTHAPYLGGVIEGNILEDCERGGVLGVEHDPRYVKSNAGRTYMTVRVAHNVVRWIRTLFEACGGRAIGARGIDHRFSPSHDPGELVVHATGNRLEAPVVFDRVPTLVVQGANYNSQRLVSGRYRLPQAESPLPGVSREASTRPEKSAR